MNQNRDKTYIDILRLISIFLVVFNHTNGFHFPDWTGWWDIGYWGILLQNEIVKMAVPVFFMISGALLLHKEETIGQLFTKRILRFLTVMVIIAVVQYLFYCHNQQCTPTIKRVFSSFYRGIGEFNQFYAAWFLYAYVGVLIMLPFLRFIAAALTDRWMLYLLGVQMIFCCFYPALCLCLGKYLGLSNFNDWLPFHPETDNLPFSAGYCMFYMLLGYYVEHRISFEWWNKYKKILVATAVICLLAGMFCMEITRQLVGEIRINLSNLFLTSFLPIPCATVYLTFKYGIVKKERKGMFQNITATLGSAVFTVMLTENLFRVSWYSCFSALEQQLGLIPASYLFTLAIFFAAILVGIVLKRIPFLRNIF